MDPVEYEQLAAELRAAIARRRTLRPGTPARWRADCEARALMKRVAAAAPLITSVPVRTVPGDIGETSQACEPART
jgi:hypothetical protein